MKTRMNIRGKATRENQGATLAIVIACALVVLLVGIAFISISLLFGGGREMQNSVDAAVLNCAKRGAYGQPAAASVPLGAIGTDQLNFLQAYLQQPSPAVGDMGPTDASGNAPVDLVTFNRLVAAAMVVQMNASADGNATGLQNAQSLFALVEGTGASSYGAQLTTNLSGTTWATADYNGVTNAARMIGLAQGAPNFTDADYGTSWIYQNANMPSNVDMSAYNATSPSTNPVLPITNYSSGARMTLPASMFSYYDSTGQPKPAPAGTSPSYLTGYTGISFGSGPTYYAVPNGPLKQPHLESNVTFQAGASPPAAGIPPNAFKVGGNSAVGQTTAANLDITSIATVGVQNTVFQPAIVNGYLFINDAGGPPVTPPYTGQSANVNTVAAKQLMSGITTDPSGYFSMATDPATGMNLINEWETTKPGSPNYPPPISDGNGGNIYTPSGAVATLAQLESPSGIQYNATPPNGPTSINCTDSNSTSGSGNPLCVQEFNPSPPAAVGSASSPCPGDIAYNGYSPGQSVPPTTVTATLTAAEMTQVETGTLFNQVHNGLSDPAGTMNNAANNPTCWNMPPAPSTSTGIRLYQFGLPNYTNEYPSITQATSADLNAQAQQYNINMYNGTFTSHDSSNGVQVTIAAGVYDYVKQYFEPQSPGVTAQVMQFMIQRLCEIKPALATGLVVTSAAGSVSTNSDEINRVLGMGTQYSYCDAPNNAANPPYPVNLGQSSFIYMNPQTGKMVLDNNGPAQVSKLTANGNMPDGSNVAKVVATSSSDQAASWNVFLGVTDPYGSGGVHDQLFRTYGQNAAGDDSNGGVAATDTLIVTASSGATGGMLGSITFQEYTTGGVNVAASNNSPCPNCPLQVSNRD